MSRDADEMTLEQAQQIFVAVVVARERWGNLWDGSEIGYRRILDAAVVLGRAGNKADADLRAQLTHANRQLGASKAREIKYRKKLGLDITNDDVTDEEQA